VFAALEEQIQSASVPVCLWQENPYRLFTLLDMLRFYTATYVTVVAELDRLPSHGMAGESDAVMLERIKGCLEDIRLESERSGLTAISDQCIRLKNNFIDKDPHSMTLVALTRDLLGAIQMELTKDLYFRVTREVRGYYEKNQFSEPCQNAFPSAIYDMEEAGKCFAFDRHTATVFHLMRALESGLVALCNAVNFTPKNPNWQNVLNELPPHIAKECAPHSTPDWKERESFYSELMLEFRHFKGAWRNYVMHKGEKFTPEEAIKIFYHVSSFMDHASSNLKE
jgi:hypothetical protein